MPPPLQARRINSRFASKAGVKGSPPPTHTHTHLLPPSCRGEENRKSVPFGLKSALQKPLCMNAEYFGLGRRRALGSCGSHRDFPLGGNAASLQCRASGAGVFGKGSVDSALGAVSLLQSKTPLKLRLRVATLQNYT